MPCHSSMSKKLSDLLFDTLYTSSHFPIFVQEFVPYDHQESENPVRQTFRYSFYLVSIQHAPFGSRKSFAVDTTHGGHSR